jgi:hypothetical protein
MVTLQPPNNSRESGNATLPDEGERPRSWRGQPAGPRGGCTSTGERGDSLDE